MLFKNSLLVSLLFAITLVSCKKADTSSPGGGGTSSSYDDLVKDSSVAYARDIYLWYNQIPSTFNGRAYADPDKIMQAIRQYSIEPGFSTPVDRWSFGMKQVDWNNLSSGVSADFGFSIFFFSTTDLRVKYVERSSPAGIAGIRRSWKITKINGSTNINSSDQSSLNFIVNAVFSSSTSTFTFQKPDGSTVDITLNAAVYNSHPVMLDSVYTIAGKTFGYMVLNSFLGDTTELKSEFNRVFNRFTAANVSDVIIDLRYNGGGYVSMQERLANYIAPSTANNQLMSMLKYNDKYSTYNSSSYFRKAGSVNINRVFFIVSSSTASASELIINDLKPYMDVKLVGPGNTHGKPVGFFPIPVGAWYIFPVSFRSTNATGSGNYFSGFAPNSIQGDGLDKDWGNVNETCLASAIKYITTGSFRMQAQPGFVEIPGVRSGNNMIDRNDFKGMVGKKLNRF